MTEEQLKTRSSAVYHLLKTIQGEDADREGVQETPSRVAKMYEEIFAGYQMDPQAILSKTFDIGKDVPNAQVDEYAQGIVVVKDIRFFSQCEHHMVPFYGHVSIAYVPGDRVVGLSKFARLVECYARRLQVQERMTRQITDDIVAYLRPKGVMVIVEAEHMCMTMRGIQKPGTVTTTSRVYGCFANNAAAREEAMRLMK